MPSPSSASTGASSSPSTQAGYLSYSITVTSSQTKDLRNATLLSSSSSVCHSYLVEAPPVVIVLSIKSAPPCASLSTSSPGPKIVRAVSSSIFSVHRRHSKLINDCHC
ncbi:Os12g0444366 [Oryza sativa Japonica Group]|uniref:Os12g0444366 protein n=1 Tax=Oryza sativa subsp. japonica TaxID=39947 RepID=A0A0P0Y9T8_ORYSJ|nr:Os12g0444366 [Oryza sativa Japonica Group]